MDTKGTRLGIIDIGSNSIRLVIYELTPDSHRIIDEAKESPRLSEHIGADGRLAHSQIMDIVSVLSHFKALCEASGATQVKAVATAAIRNASNSLQIVSLLKAHTGLDVQILSGEQEAYLGFLGTANTMDIDKGFLVDIGGGSTEVTLFRNREIVHSYSFPFGAVNTTRRYAKSGEFSPDSLKELRQMVQSALELHPWTSSLPGVPLIGLGGTMRSLGKIHQRRTKYSLPLTHNYEISSREMANLIHWMAEMPLDKRRKIDGLSKERADIIVSGAAILETVGKAVGACNYVTSGSGLRDGLFFQIVQPDKPKLDNVLEYSIRNLLALHPTSTVRHVEQVSRLACSLFHGLKQHRQPDPKAETYIRTAALLYRIGVTVNYYQFIKHTFYMIAHSRIDGLTHREILLCAMIASFKTKNQTQQTAAKYADILLESDSELISQLGSLVNLAVTLDRSQTQPVKELTAKVKNDILRLHLKCDGDASVELREAEAASKDFEKVWRLPVIFSPYASMS